MYKCLELFISVCNTSFEFYNTNNLNKNKIVTTFKGVDKLRDIINGTPVL